jgi:hypothetical protein
VFSRKSTVSASSQEQLLLDCLREDLPLGKRGWAFHIGVSRLSSQTHQDNLKFAVDSFCSLVARFQGRVFNLRNGDLVCVVKGGRISEVKLGVRRIQMLLHDDPLFHLLEDDRAPFLSTYDLDRKADSLVRLVEAISEGRTIAPPEPDLLAEADDEPDGEELAAGTNGHGLLNGHTVAELAAVQPMNNGHVIAGGPTVAAVVAAEQRWTSPEELILERFGQALRALAATDPSHLIRRQPVCLITEDRTLVPIFEEIYTSILELENIIGLDTQLTADRWLFQFLTRVLDRQTLATLTPPEKGDGDPESAAYQLRARLLSVGNFSMNLNVASVLTPQFRAFNGCVKDSIRGTIVLEFQKLDVFADLGSYAYVRDYARSNGYRICIDGLSHLSGPFIDKTALNADLMKINWTEDLAEEQNRMTRLVRDMGGNRVILCRCDSENAIDFGRAIGISLFQGKLIDQMVDGQSKAPSYLWSLSKPIAAEPFEPLSADR